MYNVFTSSCVHLTITLSSSSSYFCQIQSSSINPFSPVRPLIPSAQISLGLPRFLLPGGHHFITFLAIFLHPFFENGHTMLEWNTKIFENMQDYTEETLNKVHFQRTSCTFLHQTVATGQCPEFPMTGHFHTVFIISLFLRNTLNLFPSTELLQFVSFVAFPL